MGACAHVTEANMIKPENYFAETYGLTPTHSEVLSALPHLNPCKALDLGCGNGHNSLFTEPELF